jgi:hypothetical protein
VQAAGPRLCLDHHDRIAQPGDHGISGHEEAAQRRLAGRLGRDQGPASLDDLVEQRDVARRIGRIQPAGKHRDGRAASVERTPVRRAVDAERAARDDQCAGLRQLGGELAGPGRAAAARCPRADDRHHQIVARQRHGSAHEQHRRGLGRGAEPDRVFGSRPVDDRGHKGSSN